MKVIGLIGGMSCESTAHYYARLNERVRAVLGGLHSAEILMWSVDFAPIAEMQTVIERDPLSAIAHTQLAVILSFAGRFDDALVEAQRARELDANSFFATWGEVNVLAFGGRPREALDMRTPAACDAPSTRAMPHNLPPFASPDRFEVRYVSANGGIRWNRQGGNVSTTCAGEYGGLEAIDEGVWHVSFGPLKLGRLLERHRRIEDAYGRLKRPR